MHSVVVVFEAREGKEGLLEKELKKIPQLVANAQNLLQFELYRSDEKRGKFVLYELWKDEEAQLLHSEEQYVEDFFNRVDPLLKTPYQYMTGIMRKGDD